MPKYKVIKAFTDLNDENHVYHAGDEFPRKGRVAKKRVEELSSDENKRGEPLIEVIEDVEDDE